LSEIHANRESKQIDFFLQLMVAQPVTVCITGLNAAAANHRPSMTLIVPATSYSSSEEEDFYDANDYNDTPSSSASPTM
jgi:hypothetical protein